MRPLAGVGAINVFDSAASSVYHGLTVSARRRMTDGLYFRLAYTFGQALDDNQDALLVGPVSVQNSYATRLERGRSVTDQRHRVAVSWIWEPAFFHADRPLAKALLGKEEDDEVTVAAPGGETTYLITGIRYREPSAK